MAKTYSARAVVLLGVLLGGCGGGNGLPAAPESKSIAWRLDVATASEASFGARILLDGEQVYLEASPTRLGHRVDVVRPYTPGDHTLEVEIVSSTMSPAVYAASCTAHVTPGGRLVHADGIPWTLGIGERLRLTISL